MRISLPSCRVRRLFTSFLSKRRLCLLAETRLRPERWWGRRPPYHDAAKPLAGNSKLEKFFLDPHDHPVFLTCANGFGVEEIVFGPPTVPYCFYHDNSGAQLMMRSGDLVTLESSIDEHQRRFSLERGGATRTVVSSGYNMFAAETVGARFAVGHARHC